jgi:hypothetical protein
MQGIIRASARLLVMGFVMAAVLIAAIFAGLGITTAVAIGIVLAGVAGLVGVARRPRDGSAHEQIAAIMALPASGAAPVSPTRATAVEAMAPLSTKDTDAEKFVPRWRRPSLLEARRSDPTLKAPSYRLPMRFGGSEAGGLDVRLVRYAVVPILDRPDEILGLRVVDLEAGDEVKVMGASGAFLEVQCPNGDRGWVHRTTLAQRAPATLPEATLSTSEDGDDPLTSLLAARGLT